MPGSPDLVTVAFVETVYGSNLDDARCQALITLASDIVREYTGQDWDSLDCPAQIKLVVAQMVGDAFANAPADAAQVKAEQIGEYRVEYVRASAIAMSASKYGEVLDNYRKRAYSISAGVPYDGTLYPGDWVQTVWGWVEPENL